MSGVRASKARKMQQEAAKGTTRTGKGRNKAPKVSRTDAKKKGGKPGGRMNPSRPNAA